MIGMDDNTFLLGTFSPMYWGLPVMLLFRNSRAPPASAPYIIVGALGAWLAAFHSRTVTDMTAPVARALTWKPRSM